MFITSSKVICKVVDGFKAKGKKKETIVDTGVELVREDVGEVNESKNI